MSYPGAEGTVLIDTNALLDMALDHRPDSASARELLERSLSGEFRIAVSTGSLKDFYYVARRTLPEETRRGWIVFFLDVMLAVGADAEACRRALDSDEPDFEDGIVRVLAEGLGADAIISRDAGAFLTSTVVKLSPKEFLSSLA